MEQNTNMCAEMETRLAEYLLEPETAPESVKVHVAGCVGCRRELEELRLTMGLMDEWEAPAANPYWMTRFEARLREEQQTAPAGLWERLAARLRFGQRLHVRPLAAMAVTAALLLGGGAYLDMYWQAPPPAAHETAVVHDLQTLDNNAQLLDELENISVDGNAPDPDQN